MLFASERKLPSIDSGNARIIGSTDASRSIDRLARDVIPKPLLRPLDPLTDELYVHDYELRAYAANFKERVGEIDENYFPYYQDGAIYPPKKYDVENNYSK